MAKFKRFDPRNKKARFDKQRSERSRERDRARKMMSLKYTNMAEEDEYGEEIHPIRTSSS